jgi:hypothetical protein
VAGLLHHEIWLDEAQHFLLARDSSSLAELYKNAAYEGHPLLWNFLLFLITRARASVGGMQLLHALIMSLAVYLFLRHAPFKKIISVLIICGYFFIYEYSVISRNYAISILVMVLVFIQLGKPARNHVLLAFFLLLLSFTHLYAIVIALALSCLLAWECKGSRLTYLYLCLIAAELCLLFALKVPADHFLFRYDTDAYLSIKRIGKTFSIYLKGFFPLPDIMGKAWNSNLLVSRAKGLATMLSLLLALLPFFIFKKSRAALFFFYFSSLGICLFNYISPIMVANRHCGFVFLVFILACWLQIIQKPAGETQNPSFEKPAIAVLCLHVLSGLYLFVNDLQRPFSNAKHVVGFLKEKKLTGKPILLSNFATGPPVSAYLGMSLTYLETGKKGSFCQWNTSPFILSQPQLLEKIKQLAVKDTSILVLSRNYWGADPQESLKMLPPGLEATELVRFEGAMVSSEDYVIYRLVRTNMNLPAEPPITSKTPAL